MHLISPARSKPFGSERSHFAHSPHLLAALILLIPPEIGGELKRKARSRGCGPGFCCAGSPGTARARGAVAFRAGVVGNPRGQGSSGAGRKAEVTPREAGSPGPATGCARHVGRRGVRAVPCARCGVRTDSHPGPDPAPQPALTRCNSPAHFSPRDLPSVNSSLT